MSGLTEEQVSEYISLHHTHDCSDNQTTSLLTKRIRAPVETVWSLVRQFDKPQCYKTFIKSCSMTGEQVQVGSVRDISIISGLPATSSKEVLQVFDEEEHILGYKVLGGDHRLQTRYALACIYENYNSITSLHSDVIDGKPATLLIESYTVDVPDGNTPEDTQSYVKTLITSNLKSLGEACARLAS